MLEGTLDPDVVAGRGLEETLLLEGDWKGWIQTLLMEGLDPNVVDGRVRRDVDWKGRWIRTLLMEGTLELDVVDGRDVNWKGCWIRTLLMEGDWKGWIRTSIGRGLKGLDLDVVAGRDVESGRC